MMKNDEFIENFDGIHRKKGRFGKRGKIILKISLDFEEMDFALQKCKRGMEKSHESKNPGISNKVRNVLSTIECQKSWVVSQ